MALETPLWAAPQTALSTSSRVPTKMARSQKPCRTKTLFRVIDVRDHSGPKSDEHALLYERICDILKGINVEKAEARNPKDREYIMDRIKTGPGILKTNFVVAASLDWDGVGFQDLVVGNNHGTLNLFKGSQDGTLGKATPDQIPFQGIDVDLDSSLAALDWDGDSFNDLTVGNDDGTLDLFRVGFA